MAHPYRIREIAQQAGLSEATVDRVLNQRGGVRAGTVDEVRRAVADLDRQKSQLSLGGRTFIVDLVMQTPDRFSAAVRSALEAELPGLRPAVFRSRFHLRETATPAEIVATLERIGARVGARSSHGVILKAPDRPEIGEAVSRLVARGVPVVTLVTDLPDSPRSAYIGMDNRAAGATAAYLIGQWLGSRDGEVLVTLSSSFFRGEEEREIGGGNRAIVAAFAESGLSYDVFVAHDLDSDNTDLLRNQQISAVLHHDLQCDVRAACQAIMRAHRARPGPVAPPRSTIQIVTPYHLPS